MKTFMTFITILAAVMMITCQSRNSDRVDHADDNFTGAMDIVTVELQKAFEEQAFAVVMKNTKRVTDSVILENSRWLSEFAATRRQSRMENEFEQVSGRSAKAKEVRSEDCGAGRYCGTGDIEQLIINGSNKPIDTVVGYFRVTKDGVPYVITACDENISLDFFDICPVAGGEDVVAFIGSFEWMCPADRRFSEIFTVSEFFMWDQPKANETGMAQLYTF